MPRERKELKKYKLRAAKKPMVNDLLSGVVHVYSPEGISLACIRFSEDFVDAVGKALPFGLAPSRPAYLKAMKMPTLGVWRLWAMYFGEQRGVILWETDELPPWIRPSPASLKSISK